MQIIKGTIAAGVQITNGAVYVTHQFFYPKDLKGDVLDEKEKLSRTHDDFIHATNSVGSHFYFGIDIVELPLDQESNSSILVNIMKLKELFDPQDDPHKMSQVENFVISEA